MAQDKLYLDLQLDDKQYASKIDALKKSIKESQAAFQRTKLEVAQLKTEMAKAGGGTAEMKAKMDALKITMLQNKVAIEANKSALMDYSSAAKRTGSAFDGMKSAMMSRFGLLAIAGALAAGGKAAVQASSEFEQYKVSFEVMTGSAEKGLQMLNSIRDFANVTPFTTDNLAQNAKVLMQFGVALEEVMPLLKVLGDISGGNAEKLNSLTLAFGQMSSAGRLMGQDLLQMINAGFNPLQEISKRTGKSVAELKKEMEKGAISVGMVKQAFIDATQEGGRFHNMMQKQSDTTAGKFSALQDTWGKVAIAIGETLAPLTKAFNELFTTIGNGVYDFVQKSRLVFITSSLEQELANTERLKKAYDKALITPGVKADTIVFARDAYKAALDRANRLGAEMNAIAGGNNLSNDVSNIDLSGGVKGLDSGNAAKAREKAYRAAIEMLQAQSAKEIAINDYTNLQILGKKKQLEEDKLKLMEQYGKKGTADYIAQEARVAEARRAIDEEVNKNQEENLERSLKRRLAMSDLSRLQELEAIRENEEKKLLLYEKGTQDYLDQLEKIKDANANVVGATVDANKKAQEEIKKTAETFAGGISSTLRDLAEGTQTIGGLVKKLMLDIAEAQLNSGLSNISTNLLTPTTKDTGITGTSAGISHGNALGNILKGFAGVFDVGGIVPGAYMQPKLAVVHGKEKILRPFDPGYNGNSGGNSGETVFVYAPNVQTGASAADVFNVLEKHKDSFFGFVKQNKKRYPGVF